MILTFAEDFTNTNDLDSQLMSTPDSGLYLNRGVHPIVTIDNLLTFLPNKSFTFNTWVSGTTYNKFETSRKKTDIVTYEDIIYQSLSDSNNGNQPDISSSDWLVTDINSLRIKAFLRTIDDNMLSALSLNRKLIENQYIYNVGEDLQTLPSDYAAWVFEPKHSDYVKIRINQIGIQANTTTPQSLYIVNQGVLLDTLTLNPNNGILEFEDVGYTISGKGKFYFIIDAQEVKSNSAYNDSLKYDGFVCYPAIGTGSEPETAIFSATTQGNGLNFNVSAYLDSSVYVVNNKIDLAKFYQSQFEYDFIRMILHNANNRSNSDQRIQTDTVNLNLLATESLNLDMSTVAKKYKEQKQIAIDSINRTFDKFLHKKRGLRVKRRVL